MNEHILNRLIIIAGQWNQFGCKQYEEEFENGLTGLQMISGCNRESAVELLINHIQGVVT